MSKIFQIEDVQIIRDPYNVIRTYEGTITEFGEEFPFTISTLENSEGSGSRETITEVTFPEGEPANKRSAIAIIKDNF
jgi:hypothetical protein